MERSCLFLSSVEMFYLSKQLKNFHKFYKGIYRVYFVTQLSTAECTYQAIKLHASTILYKKR
jgi:hypothetical protein